MRRRACGASCLGLLSSPVTIELQPWEEAPVRRGAASALPSVYLSDSFLRGPGLPCVNTFVNPVDPRKLLSGTCHVTLGELTIYTAGVKRATFVAFTLDTQCNMPSEAHGTAGGWGGPGRLGHLTWRHPVPSFCPELCRPECWGQGVTR